MAVRSMQLHGLEEGVATVETEDGRLYELPAWMLPSGARAGDHLTARVQEGEEGAVRLEIERDREATDAARSEAAARLRRLTRSDDAGDLDL